MNTLKRVISCILVVLMLLGVSAGPVFAAETEWKQGSLQIFSSATSRTHHARVITKNDAVYIHSEDLAEIYNGEIIIMKKEDEHWTYQQKDADKTMTAVFETALACMMDFMSAKLLGKESELEHDPTDEYVYILKSGTAARALRYNCAANQWFFLDTTTRSVGCTTELPELAAPVLFENEIYVDLLPFSQMLGAIIKCNLLQGGLCYYIPETTPNEFIKEITKVIASGKALDVQWTQGMDSGEKTMAFFAVLADVVADSIVNGELGSVIRGDYLEDKYDDAITSAISLERDSCVEYEEVWAPLLSVTEKISSVDGIELISWFSPGFEVVSDTLKSQYLAGRFPEVSPSAGAIHSGEWLVFNTYADIYVQNKKLMDITIEGMNSAYNVFVKGKKYVPFQTIGDGSDKTCTDLVNRLYDQFYKGKTRTWEFFWENTIDLGIDLLVNKLPIAGQLELDLIGYQYDFGNTAHLSALYNVQNLVRMACHNRIESGGDLEEKLQYIYDCALMCARLKMASMQLMEQPISPTGEVSKAFRVIELLSPQSAIMGSNEYIEKNCGVTKKDILENVKYELNTVAAFTDIDFGAVLLELEAHGEIEGAVLNDCDLDGEYELLVEFVDHEREDTRPVCIIVDRDSKVTHAYMAAGMAGSVDFVYEPSSGRILLRDGYYTAGYSSSCFMSWNGSAWTEYANGYYSQGVYQEGTIGQKSVNAESWEAFIAGLDNRYLTKNSLVDIQTLTVTGNPEDILKAYKDEIKMRAEFFAIADEPLVENEVENIIFVFKDLHRNCLNHITVPGENSGPLLSNIRKNVYYVVLAQKGKDSVTFQIAVLLHDAEETMTNRISIHGESIVIETDAGNRQYKFSREEETGRPVIAFEKLTPIAPNG